MFAGQAQRALRLCEVQVFGPPVRSFGLDVDDPAGAAVDVVALDAGTIAECVVGRELPPIAIEIEAAPLGAQEQARRTREWHEVVAAAVGQRDSSKRRSRDIEPTEPPAAPTP